MAPVKCFGIRLDPARNEIRGQEGVISVENSAVHVLVVLANEELVIARETARILAQAR